MILFQGSMSLDGRLTSVTTLLTRGAEIVRAKATLGSSKRQSRLLPLHRRVEVPCVVSGLSGGIQVAKGDGK